MMPAVPGGVLTSRCGRPCSPVPFSGRRLDVADLDQVIALHHLVRAAISRQDLFHESDGFFADHLERIGRILGLFDERRLIAYGVLGLPGPGDPNFGDELGLSASDKALVAAIDGVSVAPEWRGNGLQRLLIAHRLQAALAEGRTIALSTAAPGNAASLRNLLLEGMTVRAVRQKFGGTRLVVRRDLDRPPPAIPSRGRWIALDDLDAQRAAIDGGDVGWAMSPAPERMELWYGPAGG